jgi:hypothetical protein
MPWPLSQQRAIFLRIKRQKGEAAARAFMRDHGYGKKNALTEAHKKSKR